MYIRRPLRIGVLEYPFVCSYDHMTISHMPICPYDQNHISHMPISHMPDDLKPPWDTILTILYLLTILTILYNIKGGHGLITLNPCWILTILTILTIHTYGNQSYA